MSSQWIMGSWRDMAFLSCSGVFVLLLLNFLLEYNLSAFLGAIAMIAVLDMTHIYVTGMRVWQDFHIRPWWFVATFGGLFGGVAVAHYVQMPYLLSFVLYYAMFHFMRQNYGIHRWYLRNADGRRDAVLDWSIFALMVLPFIAMHFRSDFAGVGLVTTNELFLIPWSAGYSFFVGLLVVAAAIWVLYEVVLWRRGHREVGRVVFFLGNGLLYGAAFLFGQNGLVIVFSLLSLHALQYIALTGHFGVRRYRFGMRKMMWIVGVAGMVALTDVVLQVVFNVDFARFMEVQSVGMSLLVAALLLPSLSHYTIDMWIWRRSWLKQV